MPFFLVKEGLFVVHAHVCLRFSFDRLLEDQRKIAYIYCSYAHAPFPEETDFFSQSLHSKYPRPDVIPSLHWEVMRLVIIR